MGTEQKDMHDVQEKGRRDETTTVCDGVEKEKTHRLGERSRECKHQ